MLGFGPQDWDLGLETGIWASRLEFEGGGTEKMEEKIPHMCESIGHQPLWGRYPKRARKEGWTSEIAKSDHIQKSPLVDLVDQSYVSI